MLRIERLRHHHGVELGHLAPSLKTTEGTTNCCILLACVVLTPYHLCRVGEFSVCCLSLVYQA